MGAYRFHRTRRPPGIRSLREHRPRLRQRVDPAFLVLRRSQRRPIVEVRAPIPIAVPRQLQHPARATGPRCGSASQVAPVAPSQSGANSFSTTTRNQPSHTLSPRPSWPTRFIPSFQSPEPISGRPCAPYFIERSMARTACSKRVASSSGDRREAVHLRLAGLERRRLEERHDFVQHRGIAGPRRHRRRRHTGARADRRSTASAFRVRSADATSAARRLRRTGGTRPGAGARGRSRLRSMSASTSCSWSRNP